MRFEKKIRLQRDEHFYLVNIDELRHLVERAVLLECDQDHVLLSMNQELASELSAVLTNRLAEIGFDPKYELTREGRVIDSIIDRLR